MALIEWEKWERIGTQHPRDTVLSLIVLATSPRTAALTSLILDLFSLSQRNGFLPAKSWSKMLAGKIFLILDSC